jgi:hypothetical protein
VGEKGLSGSAESSTAPSTAPLPAPSTEPGYTPPMNEVPAVLAGPPPEAEPLPRSVSGRFEEAARRAQERINQRAAEKARRANADDDVTPT